jgi:hypothetical protein
MKNIVFECKCGCGSIIWEEDGKLWFAVEDRITKTQVINLDNGLINGRWTIMQPIGAVKVQKWLEAHPKKELRRKK